MERNALIVDLLENSDVAVHLFIKDNKCFVITDLQNNDEILEVLSLFSSYVVLDGIDKPPSSMLQ